MIVANSFRGREAPKPLETLHGRAVDVKKSEADNYLSNIKYELYTLSTDTSTNHPA